jgi:hypothetical protein
MLLLLVEYWRKSLTPRCDCCRHCLQVQGFACLNADPKLDTFILLLIDGPADWEMDHKIIVRIRRCGVV